MVYTGMMMEFSVVGFIFYCFPLMFNALERDLGATQSQLSGALSLWFISSAVASIFLGRLLDKFSIKKIWKALATVTLMIIVAHCSVY